MPPKKRKQIKKRLYNKLFTGFSQPELEKIILTPQKKFCAKCKKMRQT